MEAEVRGADPDLMTVHSAPVVAVGMMFESKAVEAKRWLLSKARGLNDSKSGNFDKIVVYRHRADCHRLSGVGSSHVSEPMSQPRRGSFSPKIAKAGIKNDVI